MRLLNEAGAEFEYREYSKDPLTAAEIRATLGRLGVGPRDVLRKNDKAYKALAWSGDESDDLLVARMAEHPTLLQRPILDDGEQAVLGRPAARVLELL